MKPNGHDKHQEKRIKELTRALRDMFTAADEIAAEFIQNKRAADWFVVNEAYLQGKRALVQFGDDSVKGGMKV